MYVGKPLPRDEDYRFLTGRGRYAGDVAPPGLAHVVFVRSPHGHARIAGIESAPARAMPGVLAVLTAKEWREQGLGMALPLVMEVPFSDGRPMNEAPRPVFAEGTARHVGDPVAAVVAESVEQALDAAEAVGVDYRELPALSDVADALAPGCPVLHDGFGGNLVHEVSLGDPAAVRDAFARAAHVSALEIRDTRITGCPMEPRTYTGEYDPASRRYTLHASAQVPHPLRRWLGEQVLGVPQHRLRVIVPDVGGGFGTKAYCYPEMPVVLHAARRIGRPVRFTATRSESYQSDTHARDYLTRARLALDAEGRMLAVEFDTLAGFGAYQSTFNALITGRRFGNLATGLYRTPAAHVRVTGVHTNTLPVDACRGVAEGQITAGERLVEQAARELGLDPAEIRARNYLAPEDYPYENPLGTVCDSGNPAAQQALLLRAAGYGALREEQARFGKGAERLGIGMCAFVDHAGMGGPSRGLGAGAGFGTWEAGRVAVHPDGRAVVSAGTHSHGQGHETTFRQIAADALGIDIADIEFRQGDTDREEGNFGSAAMRSVATGGMAVLQAGERVIAKGRRLAAHLLEAAAEDLEYAAGRFSVAGTDRGIAFREVARMAYTGNDYPESGFELGLDESVFHDPVGDTFPTGMHLAVVRVDTETGVVALRDYYSVDDCGVVVNPLLVDGQIHGGLGQGIGQALLERIVYDESGQLLSGSFLDYALPRADLFPRFRLAGRQTPSPNTPLGVKGVGECGSNGPPGAIGNALADALWDLGVEHLDPPYTPHRVWQAIRAAAGRRPKA